MAEQPVTQTIYLHIGTQKTGTTTLQQVGRRNRDLLAARGVLYPAAPGDINHTGLAIYASGGKRCRDLANEAGLRSDAEIAAYQAALPQRLRAEIVASGAQKVWLSNEHLSSRVRELPQVEQLAAMLRGLAREVKIIIYLRHQPEYYLSTYSMVIKAGSETETKVPASEREYYYNYDKMLTVWAAAFGDDAINVRVFERKALTNGDVVDDIFGLMGIDRAGLSIPDTLNPSLDARALQFLQLFRKSVPRYVDGALNPEHGDVVRALEALPQGPKYRVPAEVMQRIADLFAASNARVARRYLHRADGKLFADMVYRDDGEMAPLTVDDAADIAAHLWRWKHRQITDLRKARPRPARAAGDAPAREPAEGFDA
jgi:hypothetical protein